MPKITYKQAKEFLNNIKEEDNIAIIHHDDTDGFASGIILYDWCKNKGAEVKSFSYSYGDYPFKELPLEKSNKIIITDIASKPISEDLKTIRNKQVLYTDHHPEENQIPKEILELRTTNQGYIPSSRTAYKLTGIKRWLALAGTLGDCGDLYPENKKFISEILKEENLTLQEFQKKVTYTINNFIIYFSKEPNKAFKILQKINSIKDIEKIKKYSEPIENEIKKYEEEYKLKKEKLGKINFFYFKSKFSIKGILINILALKNPDEVLILATPKKDGRISLSSRDNSHKRDLSILMNKAIIGLDNAFAGGHPAAAGGQINAKDVNKFKENIKKLS